MKEKTKGTGDKKWYVKRSHTSSLTPPTELNQLGLLFLNLVRDTFGDVFGISGDKDGTSLYFDLTLLSRVWVLLLNSCKSLVVYLSTSKYVTGTSNIYEPPTSHPSRVVETLYYSHFRVTSIPQNFSLTFLPSVFMVAFSLPLNRTAHRHWLVLRHYR